MNGLRNEVESALATHDAGQASGVPPPDKPQEVAPVEHGATDGSGLVPAVPNIADGEGGQVVAVDVAQMDQSG